MLSGRVNSKKANLIIEQTDLETIQKIRDHLVVYFCMVEQSKYFVKTKDKPQPESDSDDQWDANKSYNKFKSLQEDSELTEAQKLLKIEISESPRTKESQAMWEANFQNQWTPAYKKLTKRLSQFNATDRQERAEIA